MQFKSRKSFGQVFDILSSVSKTSCIYLALIEALILVSMKDLETKPCRHNEKEVFSSIT